MKAVIVGAGRMGLRHASGLSSVDRLTEIVLVDVSEKALDAAREQLSANNHIAKFNFITAKDFVGSTEMFDVAILASTAQNRINDVASLTQKGVKHFLIEKPLGQSYREVFELSEYVKKYSLDVVVNLNMRLYDCFIALKNDLANFVQLKGEKTITINTGTIGISANGIHYLDLLFFLLDADLAKLTAAEIDDQLIFSPRGEAFSDFGGWSKIDFYKKEKYLGKAIVSISSTSSVFGVWEITGPHGRVTIDELAQKRIDVLRKTDSQLPIHRYAGDYLLPEEKKIISPFLGDLTKKWIESLIKGVNILPSIEASLGAHKLMFDWLSKNEKYKGKFPIT